MVYLLMQLRLRTSPLASLPVSVIPHFLMLIGKRAAPGVSLHETSIIYSYNSKPKMGKPSYCLLA